MNRFLSLILLLLSYKASFAQSGWTRDKKGLYAKAGYSFLRSTDFYNSDGVLIKTDFIRQHAVLIYAEYGLSNRFTAILNAPVFKSTGYESSPYRPATGLGDIMIELKYGLVKGAFPVSVSVAPEIPTGNPKALQYDRFGGYTILPTGDGEFNVWTKAAMSHSFYPLNVYVSLSGAYNFRTMGFTNQYMGGMELGYKFFNKIWTKAALRTFGTAGTPNPILLAAIGIGEGIAYNAYNFGISYEFIKHISFTFDYYNLLGKTNNIYSGNNFVIGIAADLNFSKPAPKQ
jgi:hypothetical protein